MGEDFFSFDNLLKLQRPGRYIGKEWGIVYKDSVDLRVVLAYPDLYEIGMAHYGLQILYWLVNKKKRVICEHVFLPELDAQKFMLKSSIPLFSLESKRKITEFDLLGISIPSELHFSATLTLLRLSHLPLRTELRLQNKHLPLVIAGGCGVINPIGLEDFIDAFCIGEGEELLLEIVDIMLQYKDKEKEFLLSLLSKIEGIYVPILGKTRVKKRILKELSLKLCPTSLVVPNIRVTHDYGVIEVQRGCGRGCRFCLPGYLYKPLRRRGKEAVLALIKEIIDFTGYRKISLLALNLSDYEELFSLLESLFTQFGSRLAVSLPALRTIPQINQVLEILAKIQPTGFTLAPETGSERLQRVINKYISFDELKFSLETAGRLNWTSSKLYFIWGLPTETESDLIETAKKIKELAKVVKKFKRLKLNISFSPFVPKPFTPLQWCSIQPLQELKEKKNILKAELAPLFRERRVKIKFHSPEMALLESVLARPENKLIGEIIEKASYLGCCFDAWEERLNYHAWEEAFLQKGLSLEDYATRRNLDLDTQLAWDFIDIGIKKDFLKEEYKRALNHSPTLTSPSPCFPGVNCYGCGVCSHYKEIKVNSEDRLKKIFKKEKKPRTLSIPQKIRLIYSKRDWAIFISHLDMINLWSRLLIRSKLPIIFTSGFKPHPKISFSPPVPLGKEVNNLSLEFYIEESFSKEEIKKRIEKNIPKNLGISIKEVVIMS